LSLVSNSLGEKRIKIEQDVIPSSTSVVVVDDVVSTGETFCAVLKLLDQAGVRADDVSVMAVAEFPVRRGRELFRGCGYGRVNIQSLLVFGGA
jgi:adenine/guanine phosphoribosyltransferase-like PRPP-binding protein